MNYLMINALTLLFPFLLSFDKRVHFYKKWRPLAASMAIISPIYIGWDAIATARGDWSFNPAYIGSIKILGLPLEEVLFFFTVPYACIFIYECVIYYIGDKEFNFDRNAYLLASVALFAMAVVFIEQYYTTTVLAFTGLFLLIATIWYPRLFKAGAYWLFILLTVLPFFLVNYFLTSIPIVLYSDQAIWGIRLTTIPLEDLIYNFSMLSFYVLVYLWFKRKWGVDRGNKDIKLEVGTGRRISGE
ncbi:MAG: lycopene cyclase domain-containing protein [Candidatus Thermoplasmatota archaeon]|nr:lycopene cyclase domain-containing protein [Candidatus Thermoplasmatota archaeon]